jgi:hypothetical protein
MPEGHRPWGEDSGFSIDRAPNMVRDLTAPIRTIPSIKIATAPSRTGRFYHGQPHCGEHWLAQGRMPPQFREFYHGPAKRSRGKVLGNSRNLGTKPGATIEIALTRSTAVLPALSQAPPCAAARRACRFRGSRHAWRRFARALPAHPCAMPSNAAIRANPPAGRANKGRHRAWESGDRVRTG